MKQVFILLFLSFISLQSQWKQAGNAEKLSSETTRIVNFVISEDSKSIYTLDFNSTISKWDYATGDSIWSRKIIPDSTKSHFSNWIFLSTDGKTYCTSYYVKYQSGACDNKINIFDIDTGFLIDSINIINDFTDGTYSKKNAVSYYVDYFKDKNLLFNYLNYNITGWGPWTSSTYSGIVYTASKIDSNWIVKKLISGSGGLITENKNQNKKYFHITYDYNFTKFIPDYIGESEHTIGTYLYSFLDDTAKRLSYLVTHSSSSKSGGSSGYTKGKSFLASSVIFDNKDLNIYQSWVNVIYKFNLSSNDFVDIKTIERYPADKQLSIINTTSDDYFLIINFNNLNVHSIYDYSYLNTYTVDSIVSIILIKNSRDGEYIFLTDNKGDLYRISYKTIYDSIHVETTTTKVGNDIISISPSPATDFIEISVGANGRSPLQSEVRIYNVFGQAVLSVGSIHELPLRINTSALPLGVYFVRIGDRVSKFIKL